MFLSGRFSIAKWTEERPERGLADFISMSASARISILIRIKRGQRNARDYNVAERGHRRTVRVDAAGELWELWIFSSPPGNAKGERVELGQSYIFSPGIVSTVPPGHIIQIKSPEKNGPGLLPLWA